jgi:hypothetical protein
MKLIKFIAAAALVASTSLVSGGNATTVGDTQAVAGVCPNWPHCRGVDFEDQTLESTTQVVITQSAIKAV